MNSLLPMNKRTTLLVITAAIVLIQSCLSTALLTDFPQSSKAFDFTKISNSKKSEKDNDRKSKTGSEYYLKTNISDDSLIINSIIGAMKSEGFTVKFNDKNNGAIVGDRGTRANEWNSVSGVYFQKNLDGYEIYITCKITQDFTGGWRDKSAIKIGEKICELLKNCIVSYSVKTNP